MNGKKPTIHTLIFIERVRKLGGGLLTYIKHNITFTDLYVTTNIITHTIQNNRRSESSNTQQL